ncbi:MAG TPA: PAS domain S-box protein [Rubrobacter sp.]|nr:PAS domain S-box protein [Rubrobacter sp.]
MPSIRHTSPLLRYGVAVLAVGVAFGLKLLLDPLIVQDVPFLLVFGAIMVSAWFGGLGPGLLATVAAGLTTDYFFLDPRGTVSGFSLENVPLLVFFLEGTLVCLLAEALRAARSRAESSKLEAKRHRERLCRNEEHFRSLVEGMRNYAIFTLDPQGCVASWNAGAELREGYTSEEIVGEHFSLFFTEEDTRLGKPEEHLEAAASEGRSAEENWLVRKDGSRFWADTILTALHDDEDKLRGFSVVTQDITEKKEAERNLEEAEDRLRTLVEHEPAITYTGEVGGDHALDYVSPQIEEVLGHSPGEVMADPDHWTKMLHPHDRRWVLAEDRRTGETGDPFALEYRIFARNGGVVWLRDAAMLVRDEEGNPLHWQDFILDVTKRKMAEQKLRESEELYRNVVEQAAENIFLIDPYHGQILQANASLHHSLGYEAEELRRLTLYDIVDHDQESIDRNVQRVLDEGRHFIGERRYRRKDGSLIDVEVSAGAIAYGGRPALCVVAHDVTQSKMAEEALRRSLDALLALYETGQILSSSLEREEIGSRLLEIASRVSNLTAAVISIPDENGDLIIWRSSGLEGLWRQVRLAPEALSARREVLESREHRLLRLQRPEDPRGRHLVSLYLLLLVRDRIVGVLEAHGPEALGEEGSETLISLANQAASALENARLYAELTERENQLRRLVGKLVTAQEEERRRVAYDVHDGLAQTAATAHQHLQVFARHNPPESASGQEELDEALKLVREVVGEARKVIHDLRPTVLDDFGLAAAVRLQVQTLQSEGLEVGLEEALGDERLPPEVETTLFRVAQEALTNVRKHARAAAVHVVLDRSGKAVRLMVRDKGRGFRPDETTRINGRGERVGLSGMRERLSLLGGRFELQSEPGSSTTVTAEVNLPTKREDPHHAG